MGLSSDSDTLMIAVASDIHAYDVHDSGPAPSHLRINSAENEPTQHPISGLIHLIKSEKLRADLFLCPGDLGDKAESTSVQYAWKAVHKLGKALGASLIAAASGNHDLDSRYRNSHDPKGILQGLDPPYPLAEDSLNNKYWAKNFVIVEGANYRLMILNSSAHHGGKSDEIHHGHVSKSTLSEMRKELSGLSPRPLNIFLCHHHPQPHMEVELGDYDIIKNGQLLLDLLGEFGRWLVIHGHKHHPKIAYASGGATSPVVFSAGSLCANLYLELQTRARNQFYLISLPLKENNEIGLVGNIQAWDWASGVGWAPSAGMSSGLPSQSAFGTRSDPKLLARRLFGLIKGDKLRWEAIKNGLPEVSYLIPNDFLALKKELEKEYNLRIVEVNGLPIEVGKSS